MERSATLESSSKKQLKGSVYAEAALYGLISGLIRLPVEHPSRHTGFWAGALPAGIRSSIKELYRWPLMVSLPPFYHSLLSKVGHQRTSQARDNIGAKAFTAYTIATVESCVSCPLERLKVLLITRDQLSAKQAVGQSLGLIDVRRGNSSIRKVIPVVTSRLFQGFGALYVRQSLSWATFLIADSQLKQTVRRISGQTEVLSFTYLMVVSCGVGFIHTVVTLPVDCVKTHLQQFSSDSQSSARWQQPKLTSVVGSIFSKYSIRGFYVGFYVRLFQYMLNSIFTVTLLEHLEFKISR